MTILWCEEHNSNYLEGLPFCGQGAFQDHRGWQELMVVARAFDENPDSFLYDPLGCRSVEKQLVSAHWLTVEIAQMEVTEECDSCIEGEWAGDTCKDCDGTGYKPQAGMACERYYPVSESEVLAAHTDDQLVAALLKRGVLRYESRIVARLEELVPPSPPPSEYGGI